MKRSSNGFLKWKLVSIIVGVVIIVGIIFVLVRAYSKESTRVSIILSPHYDDAVLSLGGFIARHDNPVVVATFFTNTSSVATSTKWDTDAGFVSGASATQARAEENKKALKLLGAQDRSYDYEDFQYRLSTKNDDQVRLELTRDIQTLIASYSDKIIDVYGPALFTNEITHHDHALLHSAYLDVIANYPKNNINFYIYEDYPYTEEYARIASTSLATHLERESGLLLESTPIELEESQLKAKERAIGNYPSQLASFKKINMDIVEGAVHFTQNRCAEACEVVYKIFRAPTE